MLHPDDIIQFPLDADADGRVVILRRLSMADARKYRRLLAQTADVPFIDDKWHEIGLQMIRLLVVGWQNMRDLATGELVAFDAEKFDQVMTEMEADSVLIDGFSAIQIQDIERKKSVRQSRSSTDTSAAAACTETTVAA